jgi:flagellar biosynthesis/type III secretory pathway protein FliH
MYFSLLGATFGEALLRATESIMINGDIVTQWVEDQRRQGMIEGIAKGEAAGIAKGEAAGIAKGEAAGIAKGEAAGIAKGEAAGMAKAVLAILSNRGLTLSAKQHDAILTSTDLERLNQWIVRALTIESVDELFASS